jgi:hypothetical protein
MLDNGDCSLLIRLNGLLHLLLITGRSFPPTSLRHKIHALINMVAKLSTYTSVPTRHTYSTTDSTLLHFRQVSLSSTVLSLEVNLIQTVHRLSPESSSLHLDIRLLTIGSSPKSLTTAVPLLLGYRGDCSV